MRRARNVRLSEEEEEATEQIRISAGLLTHQEALRYAVLDLSRRIRESNGSVREFRASAELVAKVR